MYFTFVVTYWMACIRDGDQLQGDIWHPKVVYKSRRVFLKGYVLHFIIMFDNLYIYIVNVRN